jgi:hypothetical protein
MAHRSPDVAVLDEPEAAASVLARNLGITPARAREALRSLVAAGYVIGPREPTNAMLLAYITSYGEVPVNPSSVITAVGKARRRWRAMADKATAMALSVRRVADDAPLVDEPPQETGTSVPPSRKAGGMARAAALTPERRREIAVKAARTRWGGTDMSDEGEKA